MTFPHVDTQENGLSIMLPLEGGEVCVDCTEEHKGVQNDIQSGEGVKQGFRG